MEARGIWARDQIGDGKIEFWVDAESEIFDFRGLDDRTSIEHLSNIYRKSIAGMSLLACKVKSAGCFLGCVCGSLLNVR